MVPSFNTAGSGGGGGVQRWQERLAPSANLSEFGRRHGGTRTAFWTFMSMLCLGMAANVVLSELSGRQLWPNPDPLLNQISFGLFFAAVFATASFFRVRYAAWPVTLLLGMYVWGLLN